MDNFDWLNNDLPGDQLNEFKFPGDQLNKITLPNASLVPTKMENKLEPSKEVKPLPSRENVASLLGQKVSESSENVLLSREAKKEKERQEQEELFERSLKLLPEEEANLIRNQKLNREARRLGQKNKKTNLKSIPLSVSQNRTNLNKANLTQKLKEEAITKKNEERTVKETHQDYREKIQKFEEQVEVKSLKLCDKCLGPILGEICSFCLEDEKKLILLKGKELPAEWLGKQKKYERELKEETMPYCDKCKKRKVVTDSSWCELCSEKEEKNKVERKDKKLCPCGKKLKIDDNYYCKKCKRLRKKNKKQKKNAAALSGLCTKCFDCESTCPGGYCIYCRFDTNMKRAKQLGLEWTFTIDQYREELKKPCYYCGLQNIHSKTGVCIDRLDNKKGYSSENGRGACYICNMTRNNLYTSENFKKYIAPGIRAYRLEMHQKGMIEDSLFFIGGNSDFSSFNPGNNLIY